jgi:hypothetical protein
MSQSKPQLDPEAVSADSRGDAAAPQHEPADNAVPPEEKPLTEQEEEALVRQRLRSLGYL